MAGKVVTEYFERFVEFIEKLVPLPTLHYLGTTGNNGSTYGVVCDHQLDRHNIGHITMTVLTMM